MGEPPKESNLDNRIGRSRRGLPGGRCAGSDAPAAESFAPGNVNKTETHPVELLLAVALEVAEALIVLVAAAVGLLITVARAIRRRAAHPAVVPQQPPAAAGSPTRVMPQPQPPAPAPAPAVHPLAVLAEQLEQLPVSTLRPMANIRSKRPRKAELVAMVAAC